MPAIVPASPQETPEQRNVRIGQEFARTISQETAVKRELAEAARSRGVPLSQVYAEYNATIAQQQAVQSEFKAATQGTQARTVPTIPSYGITSYQTTQMTGGKLIGAKYGGETVTGYRAGPAGIEALATRPGISLPPVPEALQPIVGSIPAPPVSPMIPTHVTMEQEELLATSFRQKVPFFQSLAGLYMEKVAGGYPTTRVQGGYPLDLGANVTYVKPEQPDLPITEPAWKYYGKEIRRVAAVFNPIGGTINLLAFGEKRLGEVAGNVTATAPDIKANITFPKPSLGKTTASSEEVLKGFKVIEPTVLREARPDRFPTVLRESPTFTLTGPSQREVAVKQLFVETPKQILTGIGPSKQGFKDNPVFETAKTAALVLGIYSAERVISKKLQEISYKLYPPKAKTLSEIEISPIMDKRENVLAFQIKAKGQTVAEEGIGPYRRAATMKFAGEKTVPFEQVFSRTAGGSVKPTGAAIPLEVGITSKGFEQAGLGIKLFGGGGSAKTLAFVRLDEGRPVAFIMKESPTLKGTAVTLTETGKIGTGAATGFSQTQMSVKPLARFWEGKTFKMDEFTSGVLKLNFAEVPGGDEFLSTGVGKTTALTRPAVKAQTKMLNLLEVFRKESGPDTENLVKLPPATVVRGAKFVSEKTAQISRGFELDIISFAKAKKTGPIDYDSGGGGGSGLVLPSRKAGYPGQQQIRIQMEETLAGAWSRQTYPGRAIPITSTSSGAQLLATIPTQKFSTNLALLPTILTGQRTSTRMAQLNNLKTGEISKLIQVQPEMTKVRTLQTQGQSALQKVQQAVTQTQRQSQVQQQQQQQAQQQIQQQTQIQKTFQVQALPLALKPPVFPILPEKKKGDEKKRASTKTGVSKLLRKPFSGKGLYTPTQQNIFIAQMTGQSTKPLPQKEAAKYFRKTAGLNIPTAQQAKGQVGRTLWRKLKSV